MENIIKQKLILRGFSKKKLLNNRGLIGATIDEIILMFKINKNNYYNMTNQKIKIQDFHIGFIYEELEMDSNRYLNQGKIWVTKRYGLKSPRLFKMNKLINDGVIRAKLEINHKKGKALNVDLPQQNSSNDKNFKIAYIIAISILCLSVLYELVMELLKLN